MAETLNGSSEMHELNHRVFLYQNEMSNFDNTQLETSKEDLIEMLYSALYLGGYCDTEIKKKTDDSKPIKRRFKSSFGKSLNSDNMPGHV